MTDAKLQEFFESSFGRLESAFTVKNSSGKSLGYGFVTFSDQSVAEEVVKIGKINFQGKFMIAKRFEQKQKKSGSNECLQMSEQLRTMALPTSDNFDFLAPGDYKLIFSPPTTGCHIKAPIVTQAMAVEGLSEQEGPSLRLGNSKNVKLLLLESSLNVQKNHTQLNLGFSTSWCPNSSPKYSI